MAVQKPTLPKGTRDFGPKEVTKRKYILNTIETVFKKYGFMPIETPTMENLSTLTGKYGDEGDKLLFNILESGDFWAETGNDLSKYQYYLIESLRVFTKYVFNESGLSEDEAKNYGDILPLLENKYQEVCIGHMVLNNLFKTDRTKLNWLINKILSRTNVLAGYLVGFYREHNLQKNLPDELLNYKFNDFVAGNFSDLAKIYTNIFDTNYIKREVAEKGLRYDLTVPFARYVVMNRNEITFPFKRYQMQPVWRADRPQKGRYREFWQCDADMVGSDSLLNELDLIQIYDEAFRNLGIKYELRMNNRKVLAGIAEVVKSVEVMSTIAVAIDKLDKIGEEGVRKELTEQGFSTDELNRLFDIISIKGENNTILNQLKSKLTSSTEGLKGIEELEFILNALNSINKSTNQRINLKLDFSLARGLSYYTGCIFEVVATEGTLKSSIGGGGRYDNLTGIFGLPNVSGVGISFGLDRIYDVMDELNVFPESVNTTSTKVLVCAFDETTLSSGISIVKQLRDAGIASELYPDLPKSNKEKEKPMLKPMGYADALGIPFTIILKEGNLILKDMKAKTETPQTIAEIINHLK